jgi:hypothetical protein
MILGRHTALTRPSGQLSCISFRSYNSPPKFTYGGGSMVSFWRDHWIGPSLLADAFPALLSHVHRPHVSVRDAWSEDTWTLGLPQRLTVLAATTLHVLN